MGRLKSASMALLYLKIGAEDVNVERLRICTYWAKELDELAKEYYWAKPKVVANIEILDNPQGTAIARPLNSFEMPTWSHQHRFPKNPHCELSSPTPCASSSETRPNASQQALVHEYATMDFGAPTESRDGSIDNNNSEFAATASERSHMAQSSISSDQFDITMEISDQDYRNPDLFAEEADSISQVSRPLAPSEDLAAPSTEDFEDELTVRFNRPPPSSIQANARVEMEVESSPIAPAVIDESFSQTGQIHNNDDNGTNKPLTEEISKPHSGAPPIPPVVDDAIAGVDFQLLPLVESPELLHPAPTDAQEVEHEGDINVVVEAEPPSINATCQEKDAIPLESSDSLILKLVDAAEAAEERKIESSIDSSRSPSPSQHPPSTHSCPPTVGLVDAADILSSLDSQRIEGERLDATFQIEQDLSHTENPEAQGSSSESSEYLSLENESQAQHDATEERSSLINDSISTPSSELEYASTSSARVSQEVSDSKNPTHEEEPEESLDMNGGDDTKFEFVPPESPSTPEPEPSESFHDSSTPKKRMSPTTADALYSLSMRNRSSPFRFRFPSEMSLSDSDAPQVPLISLSDDPNNHLEPRDQSSHPLLGETGTAKYFLFDPLSTSIPPSTDGSPIHSMEHIDSSSERCPLPHSNLLTPLTDAPTDSTRLQVLWTAPPDLKARSNFFDPKVAPSSPEEGLMPPELDPFEDPADLSVELDDWDSLSVSLRALKVCVPAHFLPLSQVRVVVLRSNSATSRSEIEQSPFRPPLQGYAHAPPPPRQQPHFNTLNALNSPMGWPSGVSNESTFSSLQASSDFSDPSSPMHNQPLYTSHPYGDLSAPLLSAADVFPDSLSPLSEGQDSVLLAATPLQPTQSHVMTGNFKLHRNPYRYTPRSPTDYSQE